jgi:hypothetical protein
MDLIGETKAAALGERPPWWSGQCEATPIGVDRT